MGVLAPAPAPGWRTSANVAERAASASSAHIVGSVPKLPAAAPARPKPKPGRSPDRRACARRSLTSRSKSNMTAAGCAAATQPSTGAAAAAGQETPCKYSALSLAF